MIQYLPNAITVVRLVLVGPFVWILSEGRYGTALWLIFLMGFSDAVDGFLAKRFGWQTKFGAFLDPVADKTMLVSSYATLGWLGLVPIWLVVVVIGRDVVILAGALAYHFLIRRLVMRPSYLSKANTGVQILLVLVIITDQLLPFPAWFIWGLIGVTLLTTVASGIGYVIEWSQRARVELRQDVGMK